MLPTIWRAWIIGAMLLSVAGCKGLFPAKGQPEDPLFLTRTPFEGKAEAGPPVHLTYSQPTMPQRQDPSQLPAEYASPGPGTTPGMPVNLPSQQK